MNYPLISEYIEAIRSAEDNFDKLTNLRPVLDGNGNPIMSSGNFAVVFKMKDVETGRLYAVKCFTREQEEREERYKAIVKELEYEDSPFIVQTRYFENELFVDTSQCDETEFPIVLMDWIEGVTLDLYMKSIEDSQFRRELLADQFQKLVCWLLPKHFAHGDLKPDNIIVKEDGDIVLVDYDGMFVPALRGKEALEMGTPMFRHSGRTLSFFNEYIDDYAAVLLLVILRVNTISIVDFDKCLTTNSAEFMRLFEPFLNHPKIAPLLSAYIMVSTFGRIDRQQVSCLLANNSDYDYNKELALIDLARKGDTIAMIQLGNLYKNGIYVPQSSSKATQWYTLAHLLGNADAYPLQSVDDCYSYTTWIAAAEKGNLYAQGQLGRCYVEKDWKKAVYWWQKAAEKGNTWAQINLGCCYDYGEGIEKDISKAVYWYRKAAETGDSSAQFNLGVCYDNGEGVEKDISKAVYLYRKAAEAGNSDAQFNLGYCYRYGEGVEKDISKAVYWYRKAAETGNSDAQYNLGYCYDKGEGVEKDISKAAYWYRKAAEAGDSGAQFNLGLHYYNGEGGEKDFKKAAYWWEKAMEAGNSDAEYALEKFSKRLKIQDNINVDEKEITNIGECNTGTYSTDGKRFLSYWGTYGNEYRIKEGTEVLCNECFNDLYSECDGHYLTALYLPKSLKRIGNNVFCASISSISCESPNFKVKNGYLLSRDETILFRYFGDEKVIHISQGIKYIKGGAFSEENVEKVIIPDTVRYIGDNPFAGCKGIKEIKSNSNRFQVRYNTLYDVKEKRLIGCWDYTASHVYIQRGTKCIGKNAFFGLDFQYIDIPDSIEDIDETSFYWCFNLCNIAIPSYQYKRIYNLIPSYIRKYVLEDNGLPF